MRQDFIKEPGVSVAVRISWVNALCAVEQLITSGVPTDFCKRDEDRLKDAYDKLRELRKNEPDRRRSGL